VKAVLAYLGSCVENTERDGVLDFPSVASSWVSFHFEY
jgi:hypothetical protein